MYTFDAAHIRIRGTDLILVPVAARFEACAHGDQLSLTAEFQRYATRAGLAGVVIPVWEHPNGTLGVFCPPGLRGLIGELSWPIVRTHINRRVVVGATRTAGPSGEASVPATGAPNAAEDRISVPSSAA